MDVTPFIPPFLGILAFAAGGIFNVVIQDWTARSAEDRAAAREAANRTREWNRTRIVETRRMVLAWTEWIADVVREQGVRDFNISDYPNGNFALVGDLGATFILKRLPIDLDEPKPDALARLARLRHELLQLLDRQELRAVEDRPLDPLMSARLSAAVAAVPPTFRVVGPPHDPDPTDAT